MALIKCPECGSQISDKAAICPNCGCDPQKVLAEIREKQRLQQKKCRKRIVISAISVFVVMAIAVLAYLYYIDALNTIPAGYRKQTELLFEKCESRIDARYYNLERATQQNWNNSTKRKPKQKQDGKNEENEINEILDELAGRTLTQRQSKRFDEIQKKACELFLFEIEDDLKKADLGIEQVKTKISNINIGLLDSLQVIRYYQAKEKYVELLFGKMEAGLRSFNNDENIDYYKLIMNYAQDLQEMDLTDKQKTKVDEILKEAKRLNNEKKTAQAIAFIEDFYSYELGKNATGWTDVILKRYLGPDVLKYLSEGFGEVITSPLLYCDPAGDFFLTSWTKTVAMPDGRYKKNFTTLYWGDPSLKVNGSIYYTVETINGDMRITKIEFSD